MADGEWWRKRGPWSGPPGGGDGAGGGPGSGDEDSVYAEGAPAVPPRPSAPPAGPPADHPVDRPPAVRRPAAADDPGSPWVSQPIADADADPDAVPAPFTAVNAGDWSLVSLDFSDGPGPAVKPVPEQRTAAEGAPGEVPAQTPPAEPAPAKGRGRRRGKGRVVPAPQPAASEGAAGAAPKPSAMAGRRPSPLLLLAAVTLIGGAVSSQIVVMLVGWGLGYLSGRLTDFTRKVGILGIPLLTMSGTTLWFWGRAQGRWGEALQPGQQVGQVTWSAAPGVLRLAAVLSALFLLAVALKRRAQPGG